MVSDWNRNHKIEWVLGDEGRWRAMKWKQVESTWFFVLHHTFVGRWRAMKDDEGRWRTMKGDEDKTVQTIWLLVQEHRISNRECIFGRWRAMKADEKKTSRIYIILCTTPQVCWTMKGDEMKTSRIYMILRTTPNVYWTMKGDEGRWRAMKDDEGRWREDSTVYMTFSTVTQNFESWMQILDDEGRWRAMKRKQVEST